MGLSQALPLLSYPQENMQGLSLGEAMECLAPHALIVGGFPWAQDYSYPDWPWSVSMPLCSG